MQPGRALRRLALAGASTLVLLGVSGTAHAADAGGGGTAVQEIVVTAEKREETANKVPMSITAATGAQLALEGITQPRDLVKITPSFNYTDSYVGSPIYTLRGVGFSDISLGGRPTVSIYEDEAPIPFSIETRGASLDLERVEVLKGPQGTLFGQNATGGTINYIAAKPTKDLEAGASVSYGSYNAVDAEGFVSGPITDTLAARFSVDHSQGDGWQRSYTTNKANGSGDFTNGRLILAWTPTGRLKVQLNLNGFIDHSEVQAGQLIGITPSVPAAAGLIPGLLTYPLAPHDDRAADFNPGDDYHRHNGFVQGNLRIDYELPYDLTLTSITSYSRYTERQLQDIDGATLSNLSQLTFGGITSWSQELRLAAGRQPDRSAANFVIGFNYAYDKVLEPPTTTTYPQSTTAFTFAPFGLPLFTSFRDMDNQTTTTVAGFANFDYKVRATISSSMAAFATRAPWTASTAAPRTPAMVSRRWISGPCSTSSAPALALRPIRRSRRVAA